LTKIIIIFIGLIFCNNVFAFSNLIIFGDSLSDVGNLPAAANPICHYPPQQIDDYNADFYIPNSNPVNTSRGAYMAPIASIFHTDKSYYKAFFSFIEDNKKYYRAHEPQKSRIFFSSIWNQYFLADAYQDNLTKSYYLIPSTYLETYTVIPSDQISVNYAWATALTGSSCFTIQHKQNSSFKLCTEDSILQALQNYYKDSAPREKKIANIQIPGMLKQIQEFITDVQNGKVVVNSNTVYVIWIGGNDLSYNFNIIKHQHFLQKISALWHIIYTTAKNNYKGMRILITHPDIRAQHIYLFNMMNASLTPRVSRWPINEQRVGHTFIAIYNFALRISVNKINSIYFKKQKVVQIVPIYDWFNAMAEHTHCTTCENGNFAKLGFKIPTKNDRIIPACEMSDSAYYVSPIPPAKNCRGYMFWNAAHPAMPTQQILGFLFERYVQKTWHKFD
jgi:phospholipase/lecithinase/hemolysin